MAVAALLTQPISFRIFGFLIFQTIFLSLALVCARTPLPIKLTSTSPEVRGAFSVVFVAWQFIAALLVVDLLLQVSSEEWSFYLIKHPFQSGCDTVSTLTANVFFHIRHVFTRSTSMAYKATVCALALITILRTTAPASITTAVASRSFSEPILLAKYTPTTFDPADHSDPVMASIQRAEVFARIEQEMKTEIGSGITDNALIGRQEKEVVNPNVTTVYSSDIARFRFHCTWTAPQIRQEGNELIVQENQTQWKVWNAKSAGDIIVGVYSLYDATRSFDARSAYLFTGCDDTSIATPCLFTLQGIPSTKLPPPPQPRLPVTMPSNLSVSLLVCDPQYNITTSLVAASRTTLLIRSTSEIPSSPNNLPKETAELIFSTALLSALTPLSASPGKPSLVSAMAARVFFDANSHNIGAWLSQKNFTANILDLNTIQKNLNSAMISASKAFLIKPVGQGSGQFTGFQTVTVPATIERPAILLVGSKSFIFATIGLLSSIILCGFLIFLGSRSHPRLPLNLQSALLILSHRSTPVQGASDTEKSSRNKPLPLIVGNYSPLALDDSEDVPPTQRQSDVHWYWPRRYVFARVILFLVLQLVYYAIAIKGYVRPYNLSRVSPIPLTDFFAELKGAFIVAFTIWHTLTIALLGDIIFTIFSLEWAVQAERKRILEPGQTDRVSTLASGLFDRVKYAFTKEQGVSAMFRYAFAASIVLMVLSATGPGCFTLSTTAIVPRNVTIQNGNPVAIYFMNLPASSMSNEESSVLERAAAVTQLEQLEGFTWGNAVPPNYFFTWPYYNNGDVIHEHATMKYLSRTIYFNVACRWEVPVANDLELHWNTENPITSGVVPVTFQDSTRIAYGHSGILLVGCGDSTAGQAGCTLDLSGLPTRTEDNKLWHGTAALLACDPSDHNFDFAADAVHLVYLQECAQITLSDNFLRAKNQTCNTSGNKYAGNTPEYAGNMFAASLLYALQPPIFSGGNSTPGVAGVGLLAGQLLFDDFTATFDSTVVRPVSKVQLFEVEAKMNKYLSSATKVFMAGYDPRLDTSSSSSLFAITSPFAAKMDTIVDQMTLVGNKAMIITSMILLAIALRLLELSLRSVFWKQSRLRKLEPFGIAGVARMQNWLEREERLRDEN